MSLNQNREECLKVFGEAFNNYFNLNLDLSGGKGKTAVVEMYSSFYDKWLISHASRYMPVTPLGLISEISQRLDGGETYAFPYIKPDSFYRFKRFNVNVKTFTAETHPVTEDLKIFLDIISKADRNIRNETGEIILGRDEEKALKNSLNLYSPVYEEFLHSLGSELKLIENIPTIKNTYVFRAALDYEDFFCGENIFDRIFEASVGICCKNLNMYFPDESPFFNSELVKNMICDPMKTNDILGIISRDFILEDGEENEYYGMEDFGNFSIIDSIMKSASYETDEREKLRMDAACILETALSKWFYTIFGSYLNIIRPYCRESAEPCYLMQFYGTNKKFIDYFQRDGFFSLMPEGYNLTSFGLKLFPKAKNHFTVENELLSKLSLRNSLEDTAVFYDVEGYDCQGESETNTYVLKIHFENKKKRADRYLEFTEYNLLFDLCISIVEVYNLGYFNDFSIYTSENRSPFSKYTSIKTGGRNHKKAETAFLNEVFSDKGDKLWIELKRISSDGSKTVAFHLTAEVLSVGKKKKGYDYPVRRKEND